MSTPYLDFIHWLDKRWDLQTMSETLLDEAGTGSWVEMSTHLTTDLQRGITMLYCTEI